MIKLHLISVLYSSAQLQPKVIPGSNKQFYFLNCLKITPFFNIFINKIKWTTLSVSLKACQEEAQSSSPTTLQPKISNYSKVHPIIIQAKESKQYCQLHEVGWSSTKKKISLIICTSRPKTMMNIQQKGTSSKLLISSKNAENSVIQ